MSACILAPLSRLTLVGRPESSRFCSSVVERILGKDEVAGSNPARSFLISCKNSSSNLK